MIADLYGDLNGPSTNGKINGVSHSSPTGPATITLSTHDKLTGIGKIVDMCFGTAATDQGVSLSSAKLTLLINRS